MSHPIEELIPSYIRGLPAYIPGKPIEEVERELKIHAIKLASNENPLGPSPMAAEAARRAVAGSNWYPDGGATLLREKLAAQHGVSVDEVFIALGSSELIDLAARAVLRPGLAGLTSEGSYAPFSLAIRAAGAELLLAPQREYRFDLEAISRRVTPQTRIVYLANPNNPTGTAFGGTELDEFLAGRSKDALVVLDEAYIHYAERAGMPCSEELHRKHGNLLILRTFSKVYGLAGLRIGYGIGPKGLLAAFNRLKTPFNTSSVAQAAALAALDDAEHVRRSVETNRAARRQLIAGLEKLGLRPVPSETNFVFVEMGAETSLICDALLHRGVIVRPLGWMGFPEAARVSAGRPEENDRFLAAMSEIWPAYSAKRELAQR
jgi:histidinol-phosphate aminotransferase